MHWDHERRHSTTTRISALRICPPVHGKNCCDRKEWNFSSGRFSMPFAACCAADGIRGKIEPMKTQLCAGKYLVLIREGHWEYAERVNAKGAAIIVAVTDEQKLLLVEQYRIPVHARTIELPAGIIGDE